MSDKLRKAALAYARAGYRVVPVKPRGKDALLRGWPERASCDASQVDAWWKRWPDANVGVMPRVGEVIVDVDPRNGGDPSVLGLPANTPTQRTGGGGFHFVVRVEAGTVLPKRAGIDYKRPGKGYVLAAPSVHPSGKVYEWDRARGFDMPPAVWKPNGHHHEAGEGIELAPLAAHRRLEVSLAIAREWLAVVPADDYGDWFKVGAALKDAFGDDAFEAWDEWSAASDKYPGADALRKKWRTFGKNANVDPVTLRTLRHLAEQRGWEDPPPTWPPALDLAVLAQRTPREPESIMPGLPVGYATGTFGHGGAGKSQIELMRAVCIAAGVEFCGLAVKRRRVLFLSCEDREEVLHWRLARTCAYLGVDLAALAGHLHVLDLVGHESLLVVPESRTGSILTSAYTLLRQRVQQYGSEVLFLDGISDVYGGNENARGEVKRFVNAVLGLIPPERGAVVLIGHVDKNTAKLGETTEGYSGSTAWHNAVRARWYLHAAAGQRDSGATPRLVYELQKANHGETGLRLQFEWDAGAHLLVGRVAHVPTEFDIENERELEQGAILEALRGCADKGIVVPAAMSGRRTAYHVLSIRPEFPPALAGSKAAQVRRFWQHVEAMRQMGVIDEGEAKRADRHKVATLVACGHAGNAQ